MDLSNVVNLPPVPENIFTGLAPPRPVRSSSLSSLKSLRKVKLSLQRAAKDSSEEEYESGSEEMVNEITIKFPVNQALYVTWLDFIILSYLNLTAMGYSGNAGYFHPKIKGGKENFEKL